MSSEMQVSTNASAISSEVRIDSYRQDMAISLIKAYAAKATPYRFWRLGFAADDYFL